MLAVLVSIVATYTFVSPFKAEKALDTGAHAYIAPGPEDVRSPCPFLNTLANHGHLPRNGKNITPFKLFSAIETVYGLSKPLSGLIAFGGFFLLHQHPVTSLDDLKPDARELLEPKGIVHALNSLESLAHNAIKYRELDLVQIGAHNHIEHDASITHDDIASLQAEFASPVNNLTLFDAFMKDSASGTHIDVTDFGRVRARRERESHAATGRTIDSLHSNIARAEASLTISIFGETATTAGSPWEGPGIPIDTIRQFWWEERLPAGWRPKRETTIDSVEKGKKLVDEAMEQAVAAYNAIHSPATEGPQVAFGS